MWLIPFIKVKINNIINRESYNIVDVENFNEEDAKVAERYECFANKTLAENHIKQNKPTISIADIEKAYTWDKSAPLYIDFINNLKRIVGE
jgi:hypothetical protein